MSVEQHFVEAREEFEALVREGRDLEQAVHDAAVLHRFKPEVLRSRFERAGPIHEQAASIRRQAEEARISAAIRTFTDKYKLWILGADSIRSRLVQHVESTLGRPLTNSEQGFSERALKAQRSREISGFLSKHLKRR